MKQYNRVMLGRAGMHAAECREGMFIGVDFDFDFDLSEALKPSYDETSVVLIPKFLEKNPDKSKTVAGLASGATWTVCQQLQEGDIVLCPNGEGAYMVGEITGPYYYAHNGLLPHRRPVKWMDKLILRKDMSQKLRNSTGSIGTCCSITQYAEEIEHLLGNASYVAPAVAAAPAKKTDHYLERDLHPLFCTYARTTGILAKTIYHEKSTQKEKGQTWLHPDIIGVSFADFVKPETTALLRAMSKKESLTLYSFEMKREIHSDNELKEYYFQAVSNSSWANQGYLVAFDIDESLSEEIKRLNNAFGIGVILLKPTAEDTQVIVDAKERELDYSTIDKICNINPDFCSFISRLNNILESDKEAASKALKEALMKDCDHVFASAEEAEKYCLEHHINY